MIMVISNLYNFVVYGSYGSPAAHGSTLDAYEVTLDAFTVAVLVESIPLVHDHRLTEFRCRHNNI